MNILNVTTKTNAIFLAIVLVTGTISLSSSSSSFMTANAQAQTYYDGGMDNRHNSYEPTDYTDKNSYEPTVKDYENDNSYEPTTTTEGYGMDDNSYQKTYGNDNGYDQSQYQSYGKENRDKSKDSSKSVSINKIKCINTNLNINGNNSGNVSLGNKGQEYLGANSYGDGYYEGYDNKQGKGFECIINNNNTNTNIVSGSGNVTDGNGNVTDACEECFTTYLTAQEINALIIAAPGFTSLEQLCSAIDEFYQSADYRLFISKLLFNAASGTGISTDKINDTLDCLEDVYGVDFPRPE